MQFQINETTLENKLKVFHVEVPSDDISVLANVNAGSVYETESTAGISHLIEHCLFKGTQKRHSRSHTYNEIRLLGDEMVCYTSKVNIPFGLRIVLNDFEHALELISDLLFNSVMDKKETNKEKEIVLDEIRNGSDEPYTHLRNSFKKMLYGGCELEKQVLGSIETVESLKINQIVDFYKKMFNPSNTTLFVVGPKKFDEVLNKVEEYFADMVSGKSYLKSNICLPENKSRKIVIKKDWENVHLMMGRIVPPPRHKDSCALSVLVYALSRSVSDKILNEEPISYYRWVSYTNIAGLTGELTAYATCNSSKYKRVKELINGQFTKYSKGDIPDDYIKDAINSIKKSFILNNETSMKKAETLLDFWLNGNIYDINSYIKDLENLTIEQVKKAIKHIQLDDLTEVVLGNISKI